METIASIEKLRLKFPGEKSLLFKDLSLSIRKGEKVLILGPSGSGKSTLLQVLTGIIPHSVNIPMKSEAIQLPTSWGYVFQDPDTQFCMPYVDEEIAFVLENLNIPREDMSPLIHKYLKKVGLQFDNLHTKIQTLSGGMKQRLAIASVLALEPEVLFLDEPTAMLDPSGTIEVWETIKAISDDKTVVIVEHKIDHIIEFIDRVILVNDNGQIIADGPKEEVFLSNKQALIDYGIWYPGVWEEYLSSIPKQRLQSASSMHKDERPLIELRDFRGYRGKKAKIQVNHLSVNSGEWIGIVGENGAGKSTLLLAMMQLIKTSGTLLIKGKKVHKKQISDWMTFVFQNPELQFVTNTTFDEIAYAMRLEKIEEKIILERVNELLSRYNLINQQNQHPYQLSIGQKRRLSVAAAIVNNQPLLLLDEPTFGQDAKNTFAILEQLEQWRQNGTTIMMVTHDMHIIENFVSRVWAIEHGKLVSDVSNKEFIALRDSGLVTS